ncbi:MAG: hypothetical protein ACRDRO_20360 [Pseudonocardiaceae bacterium]
MERRGTEAADQRSSAHARGLEGVRLVLPGIDAVGNVTLAAELIRPIRECDPE